MNKFPIIVCATFWGLNNSSPILDQSMPETNERYFQMSKLYIININIFYIHYSNKGFCSNKQTYLPWYKYYNWNFTWVKWAKVNTDTGIEINAFTNTNTIGIRISGVLPIQIPRFDIYLYQYQYLRNGIIPIPTLKFCTNTYTRRFNLIKGHAQSWSFVLNLIKKSDLNKGLQFDKLLQHFLLFFVYSMFT